MVNKRIILFILMGLTALFTYVVTPRIVMADIHHIDLEKMIPLSFDGWKKEEAAVALVQAPDVEAALSKLYSNLLMRTYVNSKGERMMLSIAYGPDQRDNGGRQVHRPEVCYPAQGFNISQNKEAVFSSQYGDIPVRHLIARQNQRVEPITYWLTVGLKAVNNTTSFKLNQLSYGVKGYIPDGMLIRVSSIDENTEDAYKKQEGFLKSLGAAISEKNRKNFGFN
ncbi:exosortase-associated protein EpsI, B-type [Iodobacter fluviatilis]|uniref:EpsI family protein n=1 Tax=Iodobacter fluviatilis TaxID=537 RepID=A0A377SVW2_9NEIS|nr:exosortase-associated protein EpsI, B-type [Iodobacter fluviatilis]TCU88024.1 EpsI family protein [Iodobacter fluviatilis]STR45525.1 EpsI family protein [Iodobacter fluviatilis]